MATKRRDFRSHWAQQMLSVYQSQTESISVSRKQTRGGLVKKDGEAMSADTHMHPMGQEMAMAATQEPGTSNHNGIWRWKTYKMGRGQWLHQMLTTSHPSH